MVDDEAWPWPDQKTVRGFISGNVRAAFRGDNQAGSLLLRTSCRFEALDQDVAGLCPRRREPPVEDKGRSARDAHHV